MIGLETITNGNYGYRESHRVLLGTRSMSGEYAIAKREGISATDDLGSPLRV